MAANTDQRTYWNGEAAEAWVAFSEALDPALAPLGEAAIEVLAPRAGERILDVGCGTGATSRALAARVGPSGRVLGADLSRPMIEFARVKGGGPTFAVSDAAVDAFEGAPFDAVFSRFGVMFFEDPAAAFANLRRAAPRGRLAFVCWRTPRENPWAAETLAAVLPVLAEPPALPEPGAPGPFVFADPERLRTILAAAGWQGISVAPWSGPYSMGANVDSALELMLRIGPVGRLLREQPQAREPARTVLRGLLQDHLGPTGVSFPAATWIASARAIP